MCPVLTVFHLQFKTWLLSFNCVSHKETVPG
jgi:hypothetical protein